MKTATTLVHKGAMQIGAHAVSSFARFFADTHILHIHTDGSTNDEDHKILLESAKGMKASIVTPADRTLKIAPLLASYPLTKVLLDRGAYFTKLELPMFEENPYFYFDSDIVWLRKVENLEPPNTLNAFSTESWSWYNGVAKDNLWIRAKTPRRVNSGFYSIGEQFPYAKMEGMLELEMFDPTILYNTDQEILAYLFNDMEYYHPEDLKRSRVRRLYDLSSESCSALHFPGQMWIPHLDQIIASHDYPDKQPTRIRYRKPEPLTRGELMRMRVQVKLSNSAVLGKPINWLRKARGIFS